MENKDKEEHGKQKIRSPHRQEPTSLFVEVHVFKARRYTFPDPHCYYYTVVSRESTHGHFTITPRFSVYWALTQDTGCLPCVKIEIGGANCVGVATTKRVHVEHGMHAGLSSTRGGGGEHYIRACTSTRDRGQDLDPANFHA